jgi:predicted metal-dependent HD superfamily phosphohydrolase
MTRSIVEKYWSEIAARHDAAAFATIDVAYREPQRGYHNWDHIADLLGKLDQLFHLAARPDLIAAAIFWHDSVYVTRDADGLLRADAENVRASAALFERHSKFPAPEAEAVHEMIMSTANHLAARANRERYPGYARDHDLFLDLDLSSLAAGWAEFEKNLDRIRFEYAWVPEPLFCMGRLQMLERFLSEGDKLYRRPETRAMWLAQARANLARAESDLRARIARPASTA